MPFLTSQESPSWLNKSANFRVSLALTCHWCSIYQGHSATVCRKVQEYSKDSRWLMSVWEKVSHQSYLLFFVMISALRHLHSQQFRIWQATSFSEVSEHFCRQAECSLPFLPALILTLSLGLGDWSVPFRESLCKCQSSMCLQGTFKFSFLGGTLNKYNWMICLMCD